MYVIVCDCLAKKHTHNRNKNKYCNVMQSIMCVFFDSIKTINLTYVLVNKCHIALLHFHCPWRRIDELHIFCCCYIRARSAGVYLGWNGRKRVLKSRTYYLASGLFVKNIRQYIVKGRGDWEKRAYKENENNTWSKIKNAGGGLVIREDKSSTI